MLCDKAGLDAIWQYAGVLAAVEKVRHHIATRQAVREMRPQLTRGRRLGIVLAKSTKPAGGDIGVLLFAFDRK